MSTESPYINPLWADAVWDVSGAFACDRELVAFFDYCRLALNFEPYHIVHGAPLCQWNSGRVLSHLERTGEEIRAAGLAYEARKIATYYTFTNLNLKEEHMKDPLGNAMLKFASKHNPTRRNSIILASDCLREHVRKEYPGLKVISSILKITDLHGKGKLDVYRQLADEYDEVMVHPDDVLNYDFLEQLEDKERHILLVNEYCIRNCPIRHLHYRDLSANSLRYVGHDSTPFTDLQKTNGCQDLFTLLTHPKKNVLALNTPEIKRLRDMGFRHFKLQGRGHANSSTLLMDLLRLVLRADAVDENAMHALGQNFWEALLEEKTR